MNGQLLVEDHGLARPTVHERKWRPSLSRDDDVDELCPIRRAHPVERATRAIDHGVMFVDGRESRTAVASRRGAVPGWCYASRETLGKNLGITRQGAQKIIDRLIEMQLVEVDAETNYLRTTERWIYAVELQKQQVYGESDRD